MKKILLVLSLLLVGCVDDSVLEMKERYMEPIDAEYDEIVSMEQLVRNLYVSFNRGEMQYWFYSECTFSLDKIVKELSFLFPFDIKVKKIERANGLQMIEMKCLDDTYWGAVEEAKRVLTLIVDDTMSVDEQIEAVYHYIIEHCEYDVSIQQRTKENERAFQCVGVLFDGNAVCTGYARTFLLFMNLLKIPCLYISSDVMNHSFNLVYDGKMRYLDVTWDDPEYRYYGLDKDCFFADGKHVFDMCYDDEFFEAFLASVYL